MGGIYKNFTGRKNPQVVINLPSPPEATVGTAVTFDAHITGGSGTYTTYNWIIPDPGAGNTNYATKTAAHTYAGDGNSKVTLEVTDDKGKVGTATIKITVNPVGGGLTANFVVHEVDATGPVIPNGGSTLPDLVFFDSSTTTGGTPPYTLVWAFNIPPVPLPGGATTFTADYSFIAASTPITVDLTVTDITGATHSIPFNFEVAP
jgi:hypothetical protein